jgi:hypothetical protein
MLKIVVTEEQMKALFGCLDVTLRQQGLASMQTVVDLYNVLSAAKPELTTKEAVPPETK